MGVRKEADYDYLVPKPEACPGCGGRSFFFDEFRGELVCTNCGLVLAEHIIVKARYRQFSPAKEREREERFRERVEKKADSFRRKTVGEFILEVYELVLSRVYKEKGVEYHNSVRQLKNYYKPKELYEKINKVFEEIKKKYPSFRPLDSETKEEIWREIVEKLLALKFPRTLLDSISSKLKCYPVNLWSEIRRKQEKEYKEIREKRSSDFIVDVLETVKEHAPPSVSSLLDFRKLTYSLLVEEGLQALKKRRVRTVAKRLKSFLRKDKRLLLVLFAKDPYMARFVNMFAGAYHDKYVYELVEKGIELYSSEVKYKKYKYYREACMQYGATPVSKKRFKKIVRGEELREESLKLLEWNESF